MSSRVLALLALLTIPFAAPAAEAARPNILFVLSDDHSYPYLGCYGDPNVRTPALDQVAADGMKFHRFFTAAPQCVPARAAYLTGRSPVATRMTRFSSALPPEEVTFMEVLREQAGYFTGIAGRSYHLDGPGGRNASPTVQDLLAQHGHRTFERRVDSLRQGSDADALTQTREFLDSRPSDRPFCLWLNFSDPHHPWDAPASFRPDPAALTLPAHWPDLPGVRKQVADHLAEVNRVDDRMRVVLALLEERRLAEDTIVIFAGDNGAALPHGKGSLYDPGSNVPFVMRWPGVIKPGTESHALVSGEDLAPTLLEAAGLQPLPAMTGRSFLALLKGEPYQPRNYVFIERGPHGSAPVTVGMRSSGYDMGCAVRNDRYKLIYNCTPWIPYGPVDSAGGVAWREMTAAHEAGKLAPGLSATYFTTPRPVYELYDLQSDPSELNNRSGDPALADVERTLRVALAEKMIVDRDYLPLPNVLDARREGGEASKAAKKKG